MILYTAQFIITVEVGCSETDRFEFFFAATITKNHDTESLVKQTKRDVLDVFEKQGIDLANLDSDSTNAQNKWRTDIVSLWIKNALLMKPTYTKYEASAGGCYTHFWSNTIDKNATLPGKTIIAKYDEKYKILSWNYYNLVKILKNIKNSIYGSKASIKFKELQGFGMSQIRGGGLPCSVNTKQWGKNYMINHWALRKFDIIISCMDELPAQFDKDVIDWFKCTKSFGQLVEYKIVAQLPLYVLNQSNSLVLNLFLYIACTNCFSYAMYTEAITDGGKNVMYYHKLRYSWAYPWYAKSSDYIYDRTDQPDINGKEEMDKDEDDDMKGEQKSELTLNYDKIEEYNAFIKKYGLCNRYIHCSDRNNCFYELKNDNKDLGNQIGSMIIRKAADVFEGYCDYMLDYTLNRFEKEIYNKTIDSASYIFGLATRRFKIVNIETLEIDDRYLQDAMQAVHYHMKNVEKWSDNDTFNHINKFRKSEDCYGKGRFYTAYMSDQEVENINSSTIWKNHAQQFEKIDTAYCTFCLMVAFFLSWSRSNAGLERLNKDIKFASMENAKELKVTDTEVFIKHNNNIAKKYWEYIGSQ